jgi:hypothetical protein
VTLQYDGSGNFRVEQVTPATAQQLGLAGSGGLSRWSFPGASAYTASVADNGNVISTFNSPLGYLTATLPASTGLNPGWTFAIANDNNKVTAVQVAAGDTAKIIYPGSGATIGSLQLVSGDYELAVLQFDGSNPGDGGVNRGVRQRLRRQVEFSDGQQLHRDRRRLRHGDLGIQLADIEPYRHPTTEYSAPGRLVHGLHNGQRPSADRASKRRQRRADPDSGYPWRAVVADAVRAELRVCRAGI